MGYKDEDLKAAAERQGWEVIATADGYQFRPADKPQTPYTIHRDAPEHTQKKNISALRRRGLIWPPTSLTPQPWRGAP